MSVDISGLDKVRLLHALFDNAPVAIAARQFGIDFPFDSLKAARVVTGPIDYFNGLPMKIDISGNSVDPRLYERDLLPGSKTVAQIVAQLRKQ